MFFKVAVRNLRRERLYAVLNIAGFALGIASCLILGVYSWGELSYDRHHVNHERIYHVAQRFASPDRDELRVAQTPVVLGPMLVEDFPGVVEQYVRLPAWRQSAAHATARRGRGRLLGRHVRSSKIELIISAKMINSLLCQRVLERSNPCPRPLARRWSA